MLKFLGIQITLLLNQEPYEYTIFGGKIHKKMSIYLLLFESFFENLPKSFQKGVKNVWNVNIF